FSISTGRRIASIMDLLGWCYTSIARSLSLLPSTTGSQQLAFKLLIQPLGERRKLLVAAEKIAYHLAARLRSALLQHGLSVAAAGVAAEQVFRVELGEEVQSNHLIE